MLPNPMSILAVIATLDPLGLVTIDGAAAGVLILGVSVDLSAGAGAVGLVAGAGALIGFVVFFIFLRLSTLGADCSPDSSES
jgi:hypothetical protein